MRRQRAAGSITVLFSFILFLLISLVLVSVESARQEAAVSMLQTNLALSMKSLQGEYYAPLFDEYDIYGLYQVDPAESLRGYLTGSLDPLSDLPDGYSGSTESGFSFACKDLTVNIEKKYSLTDAGGEFMRRQMVSAGAVSGAEVLVEELLEAIGMLKEQEPGLRMLEERAKAEEKLTAMDTLLLELIPLLDGIPTNASGILCDEEGKIHPSRFFAKCLTTTEPTREAVHLDTFSLYLYLEPYYVNLSELLEKERTERADFEQNRTEDGSEKWDGETAELMLFHLDWTIPKIQSAVSAVRKLRTLQEEVKPLLTNYENKLNEYGGILSEGWMEALSESLLAMKQYIGNTETYYDFSAMHDRLLGNLGILEKTREILGDYLENSGENWEEQLSAAEAELAGYSLDGLEIRYQGMKRGTTVKDSFFQKLKNLLTDGLTAGVLDADNLSVKQLKSSKLPSNSVGAGVFDVFDINLPENASDIGGGTLFSVIRGWKLSEFTEFLEGAMEDLVEKTLVVSYAKTHFSDYSDTDGEGVLNYQLEYLLFGKKNDPDNLRRAALCILGVRLLMNIVHTFTNSEKRAQALAAATEIFGIAIPFLTKACQYVILIAWALQNAKLETAEILKGKKVPFLVTKASFQITYGEIATMDKETRLKRAEAYEDATGVAPSYGTYLLLFLMIHGEDSLVYRSMDLIQEEIREGYDPDFRLSDCLCGVAVSVQATLPGRYSAVSVSEGGGSRRIEASGTCRY